MDYPKEILVKDYFEIHDYYSNIYGVGRTIILMQVGSFHEAYCTDDNGFDLVNLAQQIDVCCTKKNGNNPLSKTNPRMLGFPVSVTRNFIDKLIELNYTIVLIDQVTEPPTPKRKVVGIFSPATHIEKTTNKTLYIVSIVLDKVKDKTSNQLCIGLSAYDLSTGFGSFYETYSKSNDILLGLDNALRFLENYPPREIILENNLNNDDLIATMTVNEILAYLSIDLKTTYSMKITQHKKIAWQKKLFENIYKVESNIDIIEMIGLQFYNWARLSLVLLLDYVMSHQPLLVDKLRVPSIFDNDKYLYLGNKALEQLNITKNDLLSIINYTKTTIGKRYLINSLTMPLIDENDINKRYNAIDKITGHQDKITSYLEDIYDLDKIIRKLEINIINPTELYQLYLSFYQIIKLCNYFKEQKLLKVFDIDDINKLETLKTFIEKYFLIEKLKDYVDGDSFYKNNIHSEIDELQTKIETADNFMILLIKELEKYIDDKVYFKKDDEESKSLISLKFNERDGHYLLLTTRRCKILQNNLSKISKIKIGNLDVCISDFEFSELPKSSSTKINCKKIKEQSLDLINYKLSMNRKLKEFFKIDMKNFLDSFSEILYLWSKKIAYIDFINSGVLCAKENHYCKPKIVLKQSSYFKAKELRHPIVERLSTETTYVPHDMELGFETKQNGILLYGINSSGKSTLMKSIGINIVLAQIGYYTAATSFEYSPYTSLFTRISGNDNIFKGLSSFMVEMMELIAILKRNNSRTLVIGDEICRGTEEKSANIIVCYMLETLSKTESSFITATHLHRIASMESVKKLDRVSAKHLKITFDAKNDMLIYDRHLSDGQGETFYGLQVAKYLMKDNMFNERTSEILNEYDNILNKTSKYNSNIYLDNCEICKSKEKLETHHIIWQKDFNNEVNQTKFHLQKNDSSNLVTLCMSCHDKVDRDEIIINGWNETSNGRKFDYLINNNKINKTKYTPELVEFIKELKNKVNNDKRLARIQIKDKFNKKVSVKSIETLWH
jgi:DNA mismatch repair protein MutS